MNMKKPSDLNSKLYCENGVLKS